VPTKAELEAQLKEKEEEIAEAKRQLTKIPKSNVTVDDGGSYAIDHGTIMDNHVSDDTNAEAIEDINQRNKNDISFWGNSWAWTKSARAYGNKPQDSWFVNPTPKLIAEVMSNAPSVHEACRVALTVGEHQDQMKQERERHLEFLRGAHQSELVSECLDLLTSYQSRFFEATQRYIGLNASYQNVVNNENADAEQIGDSGMKKKAQADVCRGWAARLIALVEAYHEVVSDERAYNLQYNFTPLPDTAAFNLYRWSVTNTLNKIGRRLARSIKTGNLDAEKYRIPRPWLEEAQKATHVDADQMIGDFN
jgi:hypothetical protein